MKKRIEKIIREKNKHADLTQDNFADMGLDYVDIFDLVLEAEYWFDVELPADISDIKTIDDIIALIEAAPANDL